MNGVDLILFGVTVLVFIASPLISIWREATHRRDVRKKRLAKIDQQLKDKECS